MIFYTNSSDPNEQGKYMAMNYFVHWKTFFVRTCASISIRFFAVLDLDTFLNYEIQIGVDDNSRSKILQYDGPDDTTGTRV